MRKRRGWKSGPFCNPAFQGLILTFADSEHLGATRRTDPLSCRVSLVLYLSKPVFQTVRSIPQTNTDPDSPGLSSVDQFDGMCDFPSLEIITLQLQIVGTHLDGDVSYEKHSLVWLPCFAGPLRCDLTPQWCYNGVNQPARHKESGDREAHRVIVAVESQRDRLRYQDDEIGPGDKIQWWVDTRDPRQSVE